MGKGHRTSMTANKKDLKLPVLGIIAMDIWGPVPTPSIRGNNHMLSITDVASEERHIEVMPDRKTYFPRLKAYVELKERQTSLRVKANTDGQCSRVQIQLYH